MDSLDLFSYSRFSFGTFAAFSEGMMSPRSLAAVAFLAAGLAGCSFQRWELIRAPTLFEEAVGYVAVRKLKSGMTRVEIDTSRIPEPTRVIPGCKSYVVWLRSSTNGKTEKLGELRFWDDERRLYGYLNATISRSSFDVFITPEANGQVVAPTHDPIFRASVRSQ